ncbi:hypothetical protein [Streptomyces sp. NPDC096193]|uniref:hypothetical protein n=1 Tax=Streptomyces sp. NPDC096193 TaxID=3155821 RepID=UPI0033274ABF
MIALAYDVLAASTSAWYDALQRALNELSDHIFSTWWWNMAGVLPGTDIVGYMGELVVLFAWLMDHLRNDDDLSCQRPIALDQFDLALLARRGRTNWHFDGDGYHELRVKYSGDMVPFPVGTLEYVVEGDDGWGDPITLPWESMSAPALAVYGGKLYASYIHENDNAVMLTVRDGNTWSEPQRISNWASYHAPALAAHDGKLHCVLVGRNDYVYWSTFDGTSWRALTELDRHRASTAVSLCQGPSMAVGVYLVHVGLDGISRDKVLSGGSWSDATQDTPWRSEKPISLAWHDSRLWRAKRESPTDLTVRLGNGRYSTFAGRTEWSDIGPQPVQTLHGPTLTVHNNTMRFLYRSTNGNLYIAFPRSGGVGVGVPKLVAREGPVKPMAESAAASHDGKLFVMYHRSPPRLHSGRGRNRACGERPRGHRTPTDPAA